MELRDYLSVLRVRWLIVVVCAVLAVAGALGLSLREPKVYEARTSVFFSVSVGQTSSELSRGFAYAQGLVNSYAQVATQPLVLTPVIQQLNLDTTPSGLASSITAEAPLDTVIIDILVKNPSPLQARDIANAVATQLAAAVDRLVPRGQNNFAPVRVTIVSPASPPQSPSSPRIPLNVTIALVLGLGFGVLLAFVRDVLDPRIGSRRDVARITDAPVIGVVPGVDPAVTGASLLARLRSPMTGRRRRASEDQAKELRTNFQHLRETRRLRSVAFVSAHDGQATTVAVANLGMELAQAGVRTVLVDADLRRPSLSGWFRAEDADGLSSVLLGEIAWADAVRQRGKLPLSMLPAGPMPHEPSLMADGQAVATLVEELCDSFDVVLIKAPPVLRVADGLLVARTADAAVVVTDNATMNRKALAEEVEVLDVAEAQVLGIVLAS